MEEINNKQGFEKTVSDRLLISPADFRSQYMYVSEFVQKFSAIDAFSPSHSGTVKNKTVKSQFLEKILVGIPSQILFIDGSEPKWQAINCHMEVEALCQFIANLFPLRGLFFFVGYYEGYYFKDLPLSTQNKILNTKLELSVLNPGVSTIARKWIYWSFSSSFDRIKYLAIRDQMFPQYTELTSLCRDAAKNNHLPYFIVERIVSHMLVVKGLYGLIDFSKYESLHVEIVSHIIIMEGGWQPYLDRSWINLAFKRWPQALRFKSQDKQDSFFGVLAIKKEYIDREDFYSVFEEKWHTLPKSAQYSGQTLGAFFRRISFILGDKYND